MAGAGGIIVVPSQDGRVDEYMGGESEKPGVYQHAKSGTSYLDSQLPAPVTTTPPLPLLPRIAIVTDTSACEQWKQSRTVPFMYGARQRPSHLICGLCPSITDTTFALQFPHMLIIHAVLEHDVSLEDVARSRRVTAPSGTVVWRLPDLRELAVLWQVTDYRS